MLKLPLIFSIIWLMQSADISITSPQAGDTLRGQVEITGNMNVDGFASAELAFSFASNPAVSWFTIQTFPQPVQDSTLAIWDTSQLTDGDYVLRLQVFLQDGSSQEVIISDLKLRNDAPTATIPPTVTVSAGTETVIPLAISSPAEISTIQPATAIPTFPLLTPLPANPASVTVTSIYFFFARGALVVFVLFIIFSLLLRLRKN